MNRYLCWLGILGVMAVPDWATACRPWMGACWGPPVVCTPPTYVYPTCLPPIQVAPPIYPATMAPMLSPPCIEATPRLATPAPAPISAGESSLGSAVGSTPLTPARSPMVEPIRPTGGSDTPASPNPRTTGMGSSSVGEPEPNFPVIIIPKGLHVDPKPLTEQPGKSEPDTTLPPLELPKDAEYRPAPAGPALVLPRDPVNSATPSSAPATPDPVMPTVSLPQLPEDKKPDGFPPLVLPPDPETLPKKTQNTSRSSPLTGNRPAISVRVFPAAGSEPVAGGYRTVGFYNFTDRHLMLTIDGQAVRLPARAFLHAQVGPTFNWSHDSGAVMRETIPSGAIGLDVVFRN